MNAESARAGIGCLCIGDCTPGGEAASGRDLFSGLPGVAANPFDWEGGGDLWERLQQALHETRAGGGAVCIAARGIGCAAALALAEQLPTDRLLLIGPAPPPPALPPTLKAPLRRICAYARRNLGLCVTDALIVETAQSRFGRALIAGGLSAHSRVARLVIRGKSAGELLINREIVPKTALSHFLQTGECPKSLAENPEMCIIDG